MGRIVKFDLYKSVKAFSTWIIVFCIIVFSIASLTITYISKTEGELPDVALDIGAQTTIIPLEEMSVVDWCIDSISGDFLMLFVIVFAVLFTCNDYANGFIKNIYNTIRSKWHYVLSKLIIVAIFTVLTILITYVVTILFNLLVVHSNSFGEVSELLEFTFYKLMLLIAYGSIGVLISFALRKSTAALVICMGYSFMFANLVYTGINQICKGLGAGNDFDIQKYTLVGNTISLSPHPTSEQQTIVLVIVGVAMILSFIVSSLLFSKRDV